MDGWVGGLAPTKPTCPAAPIHHFVLVSVGELITNSCGVGGMGGWVSERMNKGGCAGG